jgi:hypothetical protein
MPEAFMTAHSRLSGATAGFSAALFLSRICDNLVHKSSSAFSVIKALEPQSDEVPMRWHALCEALCLVTLPRSFDNPRDRLQDTDAA